MPLPVLVAPDYDDGAVLTGSIIFLVLLIAVTLAYLFVRRSRR